MKIKLEEITIEKLAEGYKDNDEDGAVCYGGKLNIRPPYQREFVYEDEQRDAVINSIAKKFPINVMYWAVREDGNFEMIDGQQRTISIAQYVKNLFSIDDQIFKYLPKDKKEEFLKYKVMVYQCTGTDSEKLDWFEIINTAGEKLTNQELRNAVYTGPWLSDAKKYFSKNGCAASDIGGNYLNGRAIRQEYLETTLKWINNGDIKGYMKDNQGKPNAKELWDYFQNVIDWVEKIFPKYRSKMKGVDWGTLYNKLKTDKFDLAKIEALEAEVSKLMKDEYIKAKGGIYPFVLTRDDRYLNLRAFGDNIRTEVYEEQKGKCIKCEKKFDIEGMDADHVTPYSKGGQTTKDNCQMLCKDCNRRKSNK